MAKYNLHGRRGDVFYSVFPRSNPLLPTPEIDFAAPGQPFGGGERFRLDDSQAPTSAVRGSTPSFNSAINSSDQVEYDRSWSLVTRYLVQHLDKSVPLNMDGTLSMSPPSKYFHVALENVLWPYRLLPMAVQTDDLKRWYTEQVKEHLMLRIIEDLKAKIEVLDVDTVLPLSIRVLEQAQRLYQHGFSFIVRSYEKTKLGSSKEIIQTFRSELHALVERSVPDLVRFREILEAVLTQKVNLILQVPVSTGHGMKNMVLRSPHDPHRASEKARRELLALVEGLHVVGLSGPKFQHAFGVVMHHARSSYVEGTFTGVWERELRQELGMSASAVIPGAVDHTDPSQSIKELNSWTENRYIPLTEEVVVKTNSTPNAWDEVENWKDVAVGRLASLRTREMFDIVQNWPNSSAALHDLRASVRTPQRRLKLTDVFSDELQQRLLHPGTSTLQILRTYISMISSFHALDNSKVLLDRVAFPLQLYLRSRDDTVKIIVAGLLSDAMDVSGVPTKSGADKLVELAILLNAGTELGGNSTSAEELDFDDLDWIPDPVDAGPGYKRSKNADIIGTLIDVLGSKDLFIKEFQTIVGENLLKHDGDFEKELKVLELLKKKFGETPLQACEVMVKDIQDSRNLDRAIRKKQILEPSNEEVISGNHKDVADDDWDSNPEGLLKPSLHAKILSRYFWPEPTNGSYKLPDAISELQERYEKGFESLKSARKLTWLQLLGQATVELQLKDNRTVTEQVHTWQAAVIWAFGSDEQDGAVTHTVEGLVDLIEMDQALVRSALAFWVSKRVLRKVGEDEYVVLETLNEEDLDQSKVQAVPDTNADDEALLDTKDGMTEENMAMYWQFIQGMLKNAASQMPLQNIANMLKMLITDGFPYSNEELQEFLGRKVTAGELELVAGKYKLKK